MQLGLYPLHLGLYFIYYIITLISLKHPVLHREPLYPLPCVSYILSYNTYFVKVLRSVSMNDSLMTLTKFPDLEVFGLFKPEMMSDRENFYMVG